MPLLVAIGAMALGAAWMVLGYRLALVLLPVWGFFAGCIVGAQVLGTMSGEEILATVPSQVVGGLVGLALAVAAYLFWYVAVVIAFGSVGYWLGGGLVVAFGIPEAGLLALAIGLLAGGTLAAAAVATGVPLVALVAVTAVGGAHALVGGLLVLLGSIEVGELATPMTGVLIQENVGWWLVALGLAVVSLAVQLRTIGEYVLQPPAARI